MIGSLRGTLAGKKSLRVTVEVGGVGYEVQVPLSTYTGLGDVGSPVTLWIHTHATAPALDQRPPTVLQAVRMIGRMGGHLGRKCDGAPGVRSLWKGWRDLELLVQGARIRL